MSHAQLPQILYDMWKSPEFGIIEELLGFRDYEERPTRIVVTGNKIAIVAKNRKRVAVFEVVIVGEGWVVNDRACYIKGFDDVIACIAARRGIDVMVLDNGTRLLVTFFSPIGRDDEGEYGPLYRMNFTLIRDVRIDGRRVAVTTRH